MARVRETLEGEPPGVADRLEESGVSAQVLVTSEDHSSLRAAHYCPHVKAGGTGWRRGLEPGCLAQPRHGHRISPFSERLPLQRGGGPGQGSPSSCIPNSSSMHTALPSETSLSDAGSSSHEGAGDTSSLLATWPQPPARASTLHPVRPSPLTSPRAPPSSRLQVELTSLRAQLLHTPPPGSGARTPQASPGLRGLCSVRQALWIALVR